MIQRDDPTPLYAQVKKEILRQIEAGELQPGDVLPPETELEKDFRVSRITVRRALNDLVLAGYIKRTPGFGTTVLQSKIRHQSGKIGGFHGDLVAQGFTVDAILLEHEIGPPPTEVKLKMDIGDDTRVIYAKKLIRANSEPIVLGTSFHNFGDGITLTRTDLTSDSVFTILRERHGIEFREAERTLEAVAANEGEAKLLQIPRGSPLLRVELKVFNDTGRMVSFVTALYRGDRYKYLHRIAI